MPGGNFSEQFFQEHRQTADELAIRTSVHSLRRRLTEYFQHNDQAKQLPYRISIEAAAPKRGYRLSFTPRKSSRTSVRIFLCHSSGDKAKIRKLHKRLTKDGFLPWLDEKGLLPGQNWESEIRKAVKSSDVVLVCLSLTSTTKEGFIQKEIKGILNAS